jgi:hypothetical protein
MAVEAPLSKYKKGNLKIYIAACLLFGLYCLYDGYLNKTFIEKHTNENGVADSSLEFNKKGAPILLGAAVILGFYFWAARDRKLVADETELKVGGEDPIPYDKMEQIDKTEFATKGYFLLTYKDFKDRKTVKKFSDRQWDNLSAVLDVLTAKLAG